MNSSKDAHPGASPWLNTMLNVETCITARLQTGILKAISLSLNNLNSYNKKKGEENYNLIFSPCKFICD
jgi:hypothetical protein